MEQTECRNAYLPADWKWHAKETFLPGTRSAKILCHSFPGPAGVPISPAAETLRNPKATGPPVAGGWRVEKRENDQHVPHSQYGDLKIQMTESGEADWRYRMLIFSCNLLCAPNGERAPVGLAGPQSQGGWNPEEATVGDVALSKQKHNWFALMLSGLLLLRFLQH